MARLEAVFGLAATPLPGPILLECVDHGGNRSIVDAADWTLGSLPAVWLLESTSLLDL